MASSRTVPRTRLTAVNRGGDTDTIGAITGAVAGARFRSVTASGSMVGAIDEVDELEGLATQLTNVG